MDMISIKCPSLILSAVKSGSGPCVVLWPSIFTTHKQYIELAERLATTHTVISIDAPGFGDSEILSDRLTMSECVDATIALLDQFGIKQTAWVGTSWGGVIGTLATFNYPERITHLSLLGTPFKKENALKAQAIYLLTDWMGNSRFFSTAVGMSFFNCPTQSHKNWMLDYHLALNQGDTKQFKLAVDLVFRQRVDLYKHLNMITKPVTIIAGRYDLAVFRTIQKAALKHLINANYHELKGRHVMIPDFASDIELLLREQWQISNNA